MIFDPLQLSRDRNWGVIKNQHFKIDSSQSGNKIVQGCSNIFN